MSFVVRPFTREDYPGIVVLASLVFPEYPSTADEMRFGDDHRDPKTKFARWVISEDERLIAVAAYGQHAEMYHPHKFWIDAYVHPEYQGRGTGKRLKVPMLCPTGTLLPLTAASTWASASSGPCGAQIICRPASPAYSAATGVKGSRSP